MDMRLKFKRNINSQHVIHVENILYYGIKIEIGSLLNNKLKLSRKRYKIKNV